MAERLRKHGDPCRKFRYGEPGQWLPWHLRCQKSCHFPQKKVVTAGPELLFSFCHSAGPKLVYRHCCDDDDTNNNFLHIISPPHLLTAVTKKSHDQCSDQRSENSALAAVQAAAADNDRGNDIEFRTSRY